MDRTEIIQWVSEQSARSLSMAAALPEGSGLHRFFSERAAALICVENALLGFGPA